MTQHRIILSLFSLALGLLLLVLGVPAAAHVDAATAQPAPAVLQQEPQRFIAIADTFVASDAPESNFEGEERLTVTDNNLTAIIDRDALFQFDISDIPTSAVILEAQLQVVQERGSGSYPLSVSALNEAWTLTDTTWATRPKVGRAYAFARTVGDGGQGVQFDVTRLVQAWVDGTIPNHGLTISGNDGGSSTLYSAEADDARLHPALSVTWQSPPSEITIPLDNRSIEIDAICAREEYSNALSFPYREVNGDLGRLFVKHTNKYLHLCIVGGEDEGESFFSAYFDVDHEREPLATEDDIALRIAPDPDFNNGGVPSEWIGTGEGGYTESEVSGGWDVAAFDSEGFEQAEYQIPLPDIERYCAAPFGFAAYRQIADLGEDYGWPSNQFFDQPQTWVTAVLADRDCPFRVRVVDNDGLPGSDATVYRLRDGEDALALSTDEFGFVQAGVAIGDELWAILPIEQPLGFDADEPEKFRFHHTSGDLVEVTAANFDGETGIMPLPVSAENPLMLRDVDVSTQWYLEGTPDLAATLTNSITLASDYLYDFTDSQFALGNVTVYQRYEQWPGYLDEAIGEADVQLWASNVLRPRAKAGGVVNKTISDTEKPKIAYQPGFIQMGSQWNRFGVPMDDPSLPGLIAEANVTASSNPNLSTINSVADLYTDWDRAFAHEWGHYLLFLFDTYFTLVEAEPEGDDPKQENLVENVYTCTGSAMGWVYEPENWSFVWDDAHWADEQNGCGNTRANQLLGRDEWETIRLWHPWMTEPMTPTVDTMPVPLTNVAIVPYAPAPTLMPNQAMTLDYQDVPPSDGASTEARILLFRDTDADAEANLVLDQGRPGVGTREVALVGAEVGERLCVVDINHGETTAVADRRYHYSCETLAAGDNTLFLEQDAETPWSPVIEIAPIETNWNITVTALPGDLPLLARFYPEHRDEVNEIALTRNGEQYVGTFEFDEAEPAAYIELMVNETGEEDDPARRAFIDVGIGGGLVPGAQWGEHAPLYSLDGLLELYPSQAIVLGENEFVSVVRYLNTYPLPNNTVSSGYTYGIVAWPPSLVDESVINIRLTDSDSLVQAASVSQSPTTQIVVHHWGGMNWRALETNPSQEPSGTTLASAASEGVGVYIVLELPTQENHQLFLPAILR